MKDGKFDHQNFIVQAAIEFWRLQKRVKKMKSGLPSSEKKTILEGLNRLHNVFEQHQVEIHDPEGEKFVEGRSLKAIYFEDVETLPSGECRVLETVKPSVFFRGQQIISGEVIVAQGRSKKQSKGA